ncbi:hypothetical protein [Limnoglobus roseus]|uniref:SMI1/KNR4 family protein n=1 Tax=Limnoglobus roseus TaxID=2598579 RepID=A0A5C1AH28_9BACT|nr:hypothetical protein [Limnoglobus roseus]QEL17296.1 SMI1/KNR4 family protein [Limnoglobus roseus]
MTEEEWLSIGDLRKHVEQVVAMKQLRKLRLFSVACCLQLEPWIGEPQLLEAINRAEKLADGALSESTIEKWYQKVIRLQRDAVRKHGRQWTAQVAVFKYVRFVCLPSRYSEFSDCWWGLVRPIPLFGEEFTQRGPALAHQLLVDIFGNPFRPVAFDPAWRTSATVGVAQQMYDARDFAAMPILADALQDAGCETADILQHCRDEKQVHVRGCWVVDLVLNKS